MINIEARYSKLYDDFLEPIAKDLEKHVAGKFRSEKYIDRISARAKSKLSFARKTAVMKNDDTAKYAEPLEQIQDLIGVRIVIFYTQTFIIVDDIVSAYYTTYEELEKHPESDDAFGYEGKHFLLKIPSEILPDVLPDDFPECFELQVKTLFQHAFSEASHDLIYKPDSEISSDQRRKTAYAAASSWGADQVLQQLVSDLLPSYPSKER